MQVLPCRTQPPDRATELRHAPLAAKYEAYRDCLRWEFGFTCAVCLVHESDVDVRVQAEHVVRQADAPHLVDEYTNLLLVCAWCNRDRGTWSGLPLLDPRVTAWNLHFYLDGSLLLPREGDSEAQRAHQVYQLNRPRKVEARTRRNDDLVQILRILGEYPTMLTELETRLTAIREEERSVRDGPTTDIGTVRALRDERQELDRRRVMFEDQLSWARGVAKRFAPIPADAPTRCRCGHRDHHSLPAGLASQVQMIDRT